MKRRVAVAALALVVPLAAGTSIAVGQDRHAARVVNASRQTITLDGAGANSIEPFFSGGLLPVPPEVLQRHGQLLSGGQQRRDK